VAAGPDVVPEGAVPSRVSDLRELPPTYIAVGSLDRLAHEDIEFASRLIEIGAPTELHVAPGAYRGFCFLAPDAAVSRRFVTSYSAALRKAFAAGT
jgi:acetyl esterase/lipase